MILRLPIQIFVITNVNFSCIKAIITCLLGHYFQAINLNFSQYEFHINIGNIKDKTYAI